MPTRPDPNVQAHLEWLGFVQPTGLVFSAPALVRAGAILPRSDRETQRLLAGCVEERPPSPGAEPEPLITDFERFTRRVLGWEFHPSYYAGADVAPIPAELELALPDQSETLRPDLAVRQRDLEEGMSPWQLLVFLLPPHESFDQGAHSRLERLLRHTEVPAGLLFNGRALRLISAPRGESSGWLEFRVKEMVETAGRPIASALRLLLSQSRLLTLPSAQRLSALLHASRAFQNEVSEQLAEQVLHALYELLHGFQAANDASDGRLLERVLAERPDDVYRALLTVILRVVFLLYAEERDMLPDDATFTRHYSLAALYDRMRADDAHYPDTMGQRYGAWAQLLALFRMVHDGARAPQLAMPARHGTLFDPDRFPFLEGRPSGIARQTHERIEPPLVSDGTIFRALGKLLVLAGERISYRALDVEQIGSVYETMMGFRLETAAGRSLAVRAQSRYGAPSTVSLDELLAVDPGGRTRWLQERADRKLTPKLQAAVKDSASVADLHAALTPVIDAAATPDVVPPGAMVLQPSEERRRSGSHYTPRSLTEPIVRTALQPVLDGLADDGRPPRPDELLDLKVCDPAMGSGAFLVEACRQLADQLVESWSVHGDRPELPRDEDELTFARRLVAHRCLYGVDRNDVAVDLAKMSLWLATLAREHAFTFLDHALRHGDSLVGLTRSQIESFHWRAGAPGFEAVRIEEHLSRVRSLRAQIRDADEDVSDWQLRDLWDEAQAELGQVRLFGDLALAAFFSGGKAGDRETKRLEFAHAITEGDADRYRGMLEELRECEPPLVPFHWEVELPEVFERERPGFDAVIGNPPFMSSTTAWSVLGAPYRDYLRATHPESDGRAVDLVAHFFRHSFLLLRSRGTFGLVATNTIGQGDTRLAGLHYICERGGQIYHVLTRLKWPGSAAVVVSVVHVAKNVGLARATLNGHEVSGINSYLVVGDREIEPGPLIANKGLSFHGSKIYGAGFTFDDAGAEGLATPLAEMYRLIRANPANAQRIFPYIGGEEICSDPDQRHRRFVISFGRMSQDEARKWPDLMRIVEDKVFPERSKMGGYGLANRRRQFWWQFETYAVALHEAITNLDRCLALSRVATHLGFVFQPTDRLFADSLVVFPFDTYSPFATLQSRIHEIWARFFGSSMKDDLRYSPSDCFDGFPFPDGWLSDSSLEEVGARYYEHRAGLMVNNNEGLTKAYNRFHDPYEKDPEIERLRELHAEMDRAVLHAYGWDDVPTDCEFLLDYEIDEEEWGKKRKPYRYRWPDAVRDEVLARLIELNGKRAKAERRSGEAAAKADSRLPRPVAAPAQAEDLF